MIGSASIPRGWCFLDTAANTFATNLQLGCANTICRGCDERIPEVRNPREVQTAPICARPTTTKRDRPFVAATEGYQMKDELTLRDYFAAKALQGMLSDSTLQGEYTEFALRAYRIADAMIKERNYER